MEFFNRKDEQRDNKERLRRKHGFSDPKSNETIETTDKYLIKRVKEIGTENIKNLDMRKHFENKIEFHEKFDNEIIHSWREFFRS